ncbi:uncharacterized protein [Parasteatoda tepidariorum]|uniref:uncharacterized protein n=1 Tax=Parasteatoda tepidariorum TaxID=114398 RepID=UPI00077F8E6E|nr:uncharacterized protein LOC107452570 [Parasteatoda tepidariorum]XP_042902673.1 uncharacterized protein LOC107452570 [Parasteatoda tepidariorum]
MRAKRPIFSIEYDMYFILSIVIVSIILIQQNSAHIIQLSTVQDKFNNVTCDTINDCSAYNGSICNSFGLCDCPQDKSIFVNLTLQGYCLESFNLTGSNCTFDQQCFYSQGACREQICLCNDEFEAVDGSCIKKKNIIIPIAVACVIAISLISTLCVYFWMSRKQKSKM